MSVNIWGKTVELFGYKTKKEDSAIIMPIENDIILLEHMNVELEISEGLNTRSIDKKEYSREREKLIQDWDTVYSKLVERAEQLNSKEKEIRTDNTLGKDVRFHKIIVVQDIDKAARSYFETGFGGLVYSGGIKLDGNGKVRVDYGFGIMDKTTKENIKLLSFGKLGDKVHIITEQQLIFLQAYLPTLQAKLDYWNWKEKVLEANTILSTDEYTLLITYLRGVFKRGRTTDFLVAFEDKDIKDFQESDLGIALLDSTTRYQEFLSYVSNNDGFMQQYLLLDIQSKVAFTEQLPELITIDYKKNPSHTIMLYQGKNLYVFHNADERIIEVDARTVYSGHFISMLTLQYIEELKDEINIDNIISCVMHRDKDDKIHTTFVAVSMSEVLEKEENIKELEKLLVESELFGWLPNEVDLTQLRKQKAQEISSNVVPLKGAERNQPCPCGSGKKYKKCCGKSL